MYETFKWNTFRRRHGSIHITSTFWLWLNPTPSFRDYVLHEQFCTCQATDRCEELFASRDVTLNFDTHERGLRNIVDSGELFMNNEWIRRKLRLLSESFSDERRRHHSWTICFDCWYPHDWLSTCSAFIECFSMFVLLQSSIIELFGVFVFCFVRSHFIVSLDVIGILGQMPSANDTLHSSIDAISKFNYVLVITWIC